MAETLSRDEFKKYLGKVGWPASSELAVEHARDRGAPMSFVQELEKLPNRVYLSEGDIWSEYQTQTKRASAA